MTGQPILEFIQAHSLVWLFVIAIFEGPIVTVAAGWLGRLGAVDLAAAFAVLVLADLVGDMGLYLIGRSGLGRIPAGLRRWMRITDDNVGRLAQHFRDRGGRTLVLGKITHSLGFAVLVAAGVGRMSVPTFLGYNLLGTMPKTLFLLTVGFILGHAFGAVESWLWRVSVVLLVLLLAAVLGWLVLRRGGST